MLAAVGKVKLRRNYREHVRHLKKICIDDPDIVLCSGWPVKY